MKLSLSVLTLIVVAFAAPSARAEDEAAPAAPADEPAPAAEPTVLLHVDSPRVVAIEREDSGELVCTSPCDARVPATARYRIAGTRPSSPFVLDARRGRANIGIDPATKRSYVLGLGVLGGGAALAIAGAITLAAGTAGREPITADGTTTDTTFTDTMSAGMVMVLGGIAAGLWGGGTALANAKTKVSGDVVADPPARGLAPSPSNRASVSPGTPGATPIMFPVLGGTF